MRIRYGRALRGLLSARMPYKNLQYLWFLGIDLNPVIQWIGDLYLKSTENLKAPPPEETSCPTGNCQVPADSEIQPAHQEKAPVACGYMSNPLLELELDESLYPGSHNNPQIPSDSLHKVTAAEFNGELTKEAPAGEEMSIVVNNVPNVPTETPPPALPIFPGEVLFTYMENAAANQQLLLGDKLANSFDSNPEGILVFESIDSISIEPNAKIPDLTVTIINALATTGQDAVYVLTDCYGTATITIDMQGLETISDPDNIFRDLNTGDVLTIEMIYTMADQFGQQADSRQTIEIFGFGQGIVSNPDFFTTSENAGLSIDAAMGKLANDTDVDTVPHLLVIGSTDAASTVESNLVITGGFGLLTVGQISISDVVNLDPMVVHEYKFEVDGKSAYLTIYKDGSETFVNTEGAFEELNVGDALQIKINYEAMDAHPSCGVIPPASSYQIITVTGLNDCPVANPDFYGTTDHMDLNLTAAVGLLANDQDVDTPHANLSVYSTETPTVNTSMLSQLAMLKLGFVSVQVVDGDMSDGSVLYQIITAQGVANLFINNLGAESLIVDHAFDGMNFGDLLQITVEYQVTDGDPSCLNEPQTRSYEIITIAGINDCPVANPDFYTTNEESNLIISAASGKLANDTDVDTPSFLLRIASTETPTVDESQLSAAAKLALGPINVFVVDGNMSDGSVHYQIVTAQGTADLTIDNLGNEQLIVNNAFMGLNTGDDLQIRVDYQVTDGDPSCLNEPQTKSFEIISITGLNDCPVANPDFYTTNEDSNLIISAASGKLANDTDLDTPHDQLFIANTDAASTVRSNLMITGGLGLLNVGDITVSDVINLDPLVVHEYKFEVDGKAAYLIIYKDGAETLINNEGAFDALAAGDTLLIKVNYQVNDGDPSCLSEAQTRSYEIITITGVNDCPVANPDFYTTNEESNLVISAASGKLANDTDVDTPHADLRIFATDTPTVDESQLSAAAKLALGPISVFVMDGNMSDGSVHYQIITAEGVADLTIDNLGNEQLIVNNAFVSLSAGDNLQIRVNYQVTDGDPNCLTETQTKSFETITITGVNDCPVAHPDFFMTDEDSNLTISAASGKLANDTDLDTPHNQLFIAKTDAASAVQSNLMITGGLGLLSVGDITVSDVINLDPLVVHEYKFEVDGKAAYLIIYKDGGENLINNEGAFDGLAAGDTLLITVNYQVNDGDPSCLG